jgi:hypothetical protein
VKFPIGCSSLLLILLLISIGQKQEQEQEQRGADLALRLFSEKIAGLVNSES